MIHDVCVCVSVFVCVWAPVLRTSKRGWWEEAVRDQRRGVLLDVDSAWSRHGLVMATGDGDMRDQTVGRERSPVIIVTM